VKFVSLKGSETRHDKFLGTVKDDDDEYHKYPKVKLRKQGKKMKKT